MLCYKMVFFVVDDFLSLWTPAYFWFLSEKRREYKDITGKHKSLLVYNYSEWFYAWSN